MKFVLCLCLLILSVKSIGEENGPDVTVTVEEEEDAILPCSLGILEHITVFDWKKDRQEVFFYENGHHYNNGRRTGQDQQFKGRVSHFEEELKNGNASIVIKNTNLADSGNYTCVFLQPQKKILTIQLLVKPPRKDRPAENIPVAAPVPDTMILNATERGVPLKCEVKGAFPQPKVEWQDSEGNTLSAEEPQVSESGGIYNVTVLTTVNKTKTNCFRCVATQEATNHQTVDEICVPEKMFEECRVVLWIFLGVCIGICIVICIGIFATERTRRCQRDPSQQGPDCPGPDGLEVICSWFKRLWSQRATDGCDGQTGIPAKDLKTLTQRLTKDSQTV